MKITQLTPSTIHKWLQKWEIIRWNLNSTMKLAQQRQNYKTAERHTLTVDIVPFTTHIVSSFLSTRAAVSFLCGIIWSEQNYAVAPWTKEVFFSRFFFYGFRVNWIYFEMKKSLTIWFIYKCEIGRSALFVGFYPGIGCTVHLYQVTRYSLKVAHYLWSILFFFTCPRGDFGRIHYFPFTELTVQRIVWSIFFSSYHSTLV